MNTAYIRKSPDNANKVSERLKEVLEQKGEKVVGIHKEGELTLVFVIPSILSRIKESPVLGLLNWVWWVKEEKEGCELGTLRPEFTAEFLGPEQAQEWSKKVKGIVDEASGAGKRKVKKVSVFATLSCPYCKMEHEWLEKQGIEHEMIYVDLNHEKAHYMIEKTGQQGVPVTEIEFEDGTQEYVIGFNKPLLEELLNIE